MNLWQTRPTEGDYVQSLRRWYARKPHIKPAKLPAIQPLKAKTDYHAKFKLMRRVG